MKIPNIILTVTRPIVNYSSVMYKMLSPLVFTTYWLGKSELDCRIKVAMLSLMGLHYVGKLTKKLNLV